MKTIHFKLTGSAIMATPYLNRWKLSKEKADDFAQLFAQNRHRFDMSCDHCSESFDTLNDARLHYAQAHKMSKGYIKCCNVKLIYRCNVIEHLYRHLEPEKFKYENYPIRMKMHNGLLETVILS